jgi:hypothetical protein
MRKPKSLVFGVGLMIATTGCASKSHSTDANAAVSRGEAVPVIDAEFPHDHRHPTELNVTPPVREACSPMGVGAERIELTGHDEDAPLNEPFLDALGACLTAGPLTGYDLALVGTTSAPGRHRFPLEGSGRADRVRSLLGRLGVPFDQMVTLQAVPEDALDRGSVWSRRVELSTLAEHGPDA